MTRPIVSFRGAIYADEVVMEPGPNGTTYFLEDARTKHYLGDCQAVDIAKIIFHDWFHAVAGVVSAVVKDSYRVEAAR